MLRLSVRGKKNKLGAFEMIQRINAAIVSDRWIWVPSLPENPAEAAQFKPEVYLGVTGECQLLVIRYEDPTGVHYQGQATHDDGAIVKLSPDRCQIVFEQARRKANLHLN